ncbi:MAG: metallophosphoesterase [bacterium]|nr:metallophosphoesterase [bacterium]
MRRTKKPILTITLSAVLSLAAVVWAGEPVAGEPGLTFFGWSDQHIQTDGNGSHLIPAIEAMNGLPGPTYPDNIGGSVAEPEFVFGCGDITEWPTAAARDTYNELVTKRLKFPAYDIMGNHDEGGLAPSETMKKWILARHESLTYTFDKGGVHFIALFSGYDESLNNPAQPITKEALDFIRKDLADVPKRKPVVVAMHLCFEALTNRDELVEAFGDANVILVLGGHYHKATVNRYRGINFVQLPSPAPNSPNEFTVIRITPDRLVAIPYDYEKKEWDTDPKKTLDVEISGLKSDR